MSKNQKEFNSNIKWVEDQECKLKRRLASAKGQVTRQKNLEQKGMSAFIRNSFLVFVVIVAVGIPMKNYFDTHTWTFRSPLVIEDRTSDFHTPLTVSASETKEVKEAGQEAQMNSEKSFILSQPFGAILWRIYQLETQRGKTDYCRLNNKGFGGFGVMVDGKIVCYKTFTEAVERANYWWGEISNGRTLDSALCKWAGHGDVVGCDYAYNYQFVN